MDLEFRRPRVGRSEIDRILVRLSHAALARCRQIVEEALAAGARVGGEFSVMPVLRDPRESHGVKLVGFFVNRSSRAWRSAALDERLEALRDLAWLRARLAALAAGRGAAGASSAPHSEAPGQPVHEASPAETPMALAYRLCVGRAPTAEEAAAWEARAATSEGFAAAFCDLRNDPESERYLKSRWAVFTAPAPRSGARDVLREGIVYSYQLTVGRTPGPGEIDSWMGTLRSGMGFGEYLRVMHGSPEATQYRKSELARIPDGRFVQLVYESVLGYGVDARVIARWERELASGRIDRTALLTGIFKTYAAAFAAEGEAQVKQVHNALHCSIACTGKVLTPEIWSQRAEEIARGEPQAPRETFAARFHILRKPGPLVSAIASLYRGGAFIEQFLDNITSQTCFRDYCELVIVDADSPENESAVIEKYSRQHGNIVYRRMDYRIGIYDAWNVGARLARGEYLTNTNLDDLRREDSLELQAGVLENLPFVDVAYQEFYYTFDPRLTFEEIARFGFRGNVPVVTRHNMMDFNSPHNAPMWRKRLHDELGYFDTSYKSAGDYEFWMRCVVAGKVFYKVNDPHVAYYQNPEGISTRPDTRGVEEGRRIFKTYARQLVPEAVVMPVDQFARTYLPGIAETPAPGTSRYGLCQRALRELAMTRKYRPPARGEAP